MRATEFITEAFLNEVGPDYNNPNDVRSWIDRLKRIIKESNFIGERSNARDLLNKILAKMGMAPDEPEDDSDDDSSDSALGSFKVVFFGHFYDPDYGVRGSDKVWGWGVKDNYIYQFWGPNGGTPGVKRMPNTAVNRANLDRKARQKERKGYNRIRAADHVEWLKSVLSAKPRFGE